MVWPSASPATAQPASRAAANRYYIVSSTFRDNASIFEPTGMIAAQVRPRERVLVHEIDLSYVVLHWARRLRNGRALTERFGERVGFRYYEAEDVGIFWSNDPTTPIEAMIEELGIATRDAEIERNRRMQNALRGGPPRP